jgi:reactive intermediate/imine deaminase
MQKHGQGFMAGDPDKSMQLINPSTLAQPGGHYSHAVVHGGLVYISGQLPITPSGDKLAHASFAQQAAQVLANVKAAVEGAGSQIDRLIQVRVYVDDVANWPEFNAIYAQWIGAHRPARAVVPVSALHYGLKIEIEATAALTTD